MGEHTVNIKGNLYRYVYDPDTQGMKYLGPVGSAPEISEEQFLKEVEPEPVTIQMKKVNDFWLVERKSELDVRFYTRHLPAEKIYDEDGFLVDIRGTHGVADNMEQIVEFLDWIPEDERGKYLLRVGTIKKSDQTPQGGWRWHKWGEYIGDQTSTTEYLYDEPDVDEVMIFSLEVIEGIMPEDIFERRKAKLKEMGIWDLMPEMVHMPVDEE